MTQKIVIILCLLSLLLGMLIVPVSAASADEGVVRWSIDAEGTLWITGNGALPDFQYTTARDNEPPWIQYNDYIQTIVICSGITYIENESFAYLTNVTSAWISDTVKNIGRYAFLECSSLQYVSIPNGVETIGEGVFKSCYALTDITLPDSVISLGGGAFAGCINLRNVTLPKNLTMIDSKTFQYCRSLTTITLPEGIQQLSPGAFESSGLTHIELPSTLNEIYGDAFAYTPFMEITIPASVTYIMWNVFDGRPANRKIRFLGDIPDMQPNIFDESVPVICYYPKDNPTWTEEVRQSYEGAITWIPYCGSRHSWEDWTIIAAATCTEAGMKQRSCTQCDTIEKAVIAKTAHSYEQWNTVIDTTCFREGTMISICSVCQALGSEKLPLAEHAYHEEITLPSCTEEGFTTYTCTVCAHTFTDAYTAIADHLYGEWTITQPRSWTTEGVQKRICTSCSKEQIEFLPMLLADGWVITGIAVIGFALISGIIVILVVLRKKRHKNAEIPEQTSESQETEGP